MFTYTEKLLQFISKQYHTIFNIITETTTITGALPRPCWLLTWIYRQIVIDCYISCIG